MKTKAKRGDHIRIRYYDAKAKENQRPTITVLKVWRSDVVGVHEPTGIIYSTLWEHPKGNTPGQRAKHHFRVNERHWVKWDRGIFSFGHGMGLALERAVGVDIPRYSKFARDCARVGAELELLPGNPFEEFSRLDGQLRKLASQLNGTSPEMLEARGKLERCILVYDDEAVNGFRACIVRVRLKAVERRFMERLNHMLNWHPKYVARLELTQRARVRVTQMLEGGYHELDLLRIYARKCNITTRIQPALKGTLKRTRDDVARWQVVRPFTTWAGLTVADLNDCITAVEKKNGDQLFELVVRLHATFRLQILRLDLEDLLLLVHRLNNGATTGRGKPKASRADEKMLARVSEVAMMIGRVDDHDWKVPVISEICESIERASLLLAAGEAGKAARLLRQATSLI